MGETPVGQIQHSVTAALPPRPAITGHLSQPVHTRKTSLQNPCIMLAQANMNLLRAANFIACLSLIQLLLPGCGSSTLPPPLTRAQTQRWQSTHLDQTVGVEPYRLSAYSDALLTALRNTHLFASVNLLQDCPATPTLIARVNQPYNGGVATIPIWSALTLGIVPTVAHESFGYDFSLQPTGGNGAKRFIQYACPSTTTLGWVALFQALSPDVELWSCERSDRFRGRLALAILDQLSERPMRKP